MISHTFIIRRTNVTRLCENHTIVIVNNQLPGPTLFARNGDTLDVTVTNLPQYNVTIHWNGIKLILCNPQPFHGATDKARELFNELFSCQ